MLGRCGSASATAPERQASIPSGWQQPRSTRRRLGFESFYLPEHMALHVGARVGDFEIPPATPIADPLECLAFVAASTSGILLGTAVLLLPYHQPVVLAKRLATLDVLSRGRMRLLTVGVGALPGEAAAVGVDYRTRGRRADEAIDVLRALWAGDAGGTTFTGRFFSFEDVTSFPKPHGVDTLPIHVGGSSPAAAPQAGRRGGGGVPRRLVPPPGRAAQGGAGGGGGGPPGAGPRRRSARRSGSWCVRPRRKRAGIRIGSSTPDGRPWRPNRPASRALPGKGSRGSWSASPRRISTSCAVTSRPLPSCTPWCEDPPLMQPARGRRHYQHRRGAVASSRRRRCRSDRAQP